MANFLDKVGLQEATQLLKDYINNKDIFVLGYYEPKTNTFRSVGNKSNHIYDTFSAQTVPYAYNDVKVFGGDIQYEALIEGDTKKLYIDQTYGTNDIYKYTGNGYIKLGEYPEVILHGNEKPWGAGVPAVGNDGGMSVGNAIDFHTSKDGSTLKSYGDSTATPLYRYNVRLQATEGQDITVNLPSEPGTLALTSQLPTTASDNNQGTVKVGNGLRIDSEGKLSIKVGSGLKINSSGSLSVKGAFEQMYTTDGTRRISLSNGDIGGITITEWDNSDPYIYICYDGDNSSDPPEVGVPYENTLFISIPESAGVTDLKIVPLELYTGTPSSSAHVKVFGDQISDTEFMVRIISYYDGTNLYVWEHFSQINGEEINKDTY